jgi:hypothetical protein
MPNHFDPAVIGGKSGDSGYRFDGDVSAIANSLRALADDLEAKRAHVEKVHSGSRVVAQNFAMRSLLIRYFTRED